MTPEDVIRTILHLLREKHRNPHMNLVPTISLTTGSWVELCTILDTTITFLENELSRTRSVEEFLTQFATLIDFGQITADLNLNPGNEPC